MKKQSPMNTKSHRDGRTVTVQVGKIVAIRNSEAEARQAAEKAIQSRLKEGPPWTP